MNNKEIILILRKISFLLEVKGENKFKFQAYETAADIIEVQQLDVVSLVKENKLKDINGFGKALCEKIEDFVKNEKMSYYEILKSEIPESLYELKELKGLGAKRISKLYNELSVKDIRTLKEVIADNSILKIEGFGNKLVESIKNNL